MVAERRPLGIPACQLDQLRAAPVVAAEERHLDPALARLLDLQRDLVVIARQEDDVGSGGRDPAQRGGEILVAGLVRLEGDDLSSRLLEVLPEELSLAPGRLRVRVVENGRLRGVEESRREPREDVPLEGVGEAGAKDPFLPRRRQRVRGPGSDHRDPRFLRDLGGGDRAHARVRTHDREHLVFRGEALQGLPGLRRVSLAVFHDETESIRLSGDLHAAGLVDLPDGHLGRVLARGADGGNVAGELGDHSDREVGELLLSAGSGERRGREQEKKKSGMSSHESVLQKRGRYVIREVEFRLPIRSRTCLSRPFSSLP